MNNNWLFETVLSSGVGVTWVRRRTGEMEVLVSFENNVISFRAGAGGFIDLVVYVFLSNVD